MQTTAKCLHVAKVCNIIYKIATVLCKHAVIFRKHANASTQSETHIQCIAGILATNCTFEV